MLTQPHFVEADGVQMFDELQVALQSQRRIGAGAVEWGDELSEPELRH